MSFNGTNRVRFVAIVRRNASEATPSISDAHVLEIERCSYVFEEQRRDFQLLDYTHIRQLVNIELLFQISVAYHGQVRNDGESVDLYGQITIPDNGPVDWVDIANDLVDPDRDVFLWPILDNGEGDIDTDTFYKVIGDTDSYNFVSARNSGFFDPQLPINMIVQQPLDEYPDWAKRK
jgi:hypothetical protein